MNDKEQLARALMQAYLGSDYENEPLSDADLMLRDSVESALNERGFSIVATDEIEELKAQVNCLREVLEQLAKLGNGDKYGNSIGNTIAINALIATPEQCLAEVKAKAIEDSMPKIINACVKYSVEKYMNTSVEMVSVGQLKHLSEIRHHGEWEQAK